MKIEIRSSLLKDIKNIQKAQKLRLEEVYLSLKECEEIAQIPNIKKLKGFENFYRIRIGDYRLGLAIEDDRVILLHFLHRKDIYKFFP
ncbi:MAG: type II toxin-antitoxin system RelE/ParE family toxin [Campylobacterales bacterium]|nr:type II toxin-antitoxin system RelE/ParE family toxin [Campylobacterota bacterium]MBD3843962.1 type II toxin-antitoxin system RelE/ParE family toxin [Campylobacterales bacterium]